MKWFEQAQSGYTMDARFHPLNYRVFRWQTATVDYFILWVLYALTFKEAKIEKAKEKKKKVEGT